MNIVAINSAQLFPFARKHGAHQMPVKKPAVCSQENIYLLLEVASNELAADQLEASLYHLHLAIDRLQRVLALNRQTICAATTYRQGKETA